MPNIHSRKLTEKQVALLKNLEWSEIDSGEKLEPIKDDNELMTALEASLSDLPDTREATEFIQRTKREFDAIRRKHRTPTINFRTKLVFAGVITTVVVGTILIFNRQGFKND